MPVTPEQNEEWQKAIPLLDYSDLHALTEKGLQQSAGRLIRGKVPSWAVHLREKLIANAWPYYPWVPDFALRSEVALIGLQLLYPDKFDAGQIYRNVRLRLIHEALRPFVEHTEQLTAQGKDVLRTCYLPLLQLYEVTTFTTVPPDGSVFPAVLASAEERERWLDRYGEDLELREGLQAVKLTIELAKNWTRRPVDTYPVCDLLNDLHHWRLGADPRKLYQTLPPPGTEHSYTHYGFIGTAFRIALESECPPPDWLS